MSEMNQCSELQRYAEDLERREGAEPAPGLLAHMDDCEECREELQQVRRVAARMLAHQFEDNGHGPHLTDLEMATFATEGLGGGRRVCRRAPRRAAAAAGSSVISGVCSSSMRT